MPIAEDLLKIKRQIPGNVSLVAVSKTKPYESLLEAYRTGHRIFGENKALEMTDKYEHLPKDIEWHFLGHLQTNKVRYLAPFVTCIQSVDSLKLLKAIDTEAVKANHRIDCLLQIRIAREETKYGLSETDAESILSSDEYHRMSNIRITGVMGMATFTDDMELVRNEFRKLSAIFKILQKKFFLYNPDFREISMGMSQDYLTAIEEGATIVRIGSLIFGERNT
jgi:PLP dependent protein